jgi:hypothetical protein
MRMLLKMHAKCRIGVSQYGILGRVPRNFRVFHVAQQSVAQRCYEHYTTNVLDTPAGYYFGIAPFLLSSVRLGLSWPNLCSVPNTQVNGTLVLTG